MKQLIADRETFTDPYWIFSDECTVQLERHRRKCFSNEKYGGKLLLIKGTAKHPVKVHVWAGISLKGATKVCIFPGKTRMDSALYCRIIKQAFLPFVSRKFPNGNCLLQQDNCPTHVSKYSLKQFAEMGVKTVAWPPESPDLNPIELVWHQLKEYLHADVKPMTQEELIDGIKMFWSLKMTKNLCKRYIHHNYTVMPLILERDGKATLK